MVELLRRCALSSFLATTLALGVAAGDASSAGRHTVRIYSSLPLQGDSRPQSEDIVKAIELALEEHGGRAGNVTIEYVSLDDATVEQGHWDAERVAANARLAATDDMTIAYIGEFNSLASAVSIPILNEAGILQVSPSNTSVGLTRSEGAGAGEPERYYPTGERTYGRVVPAEHLQAAALVAFMEDRGCTGIYLSTDGELYGEGMAAQVETIASEQQIEVVGNDAITDETFTDLPRTIRDSGADCFFYGGFTQSGAVEVFQHVAGANPGISMFGPDGIAESAFTQEVGADLEARIFITNPTVPAEHYPEAGQEFFEVFASRYGHQPEPYAIYGYEAMNAVLLAIENAGDRLTPGPAGRAAVVEEFFNIEDRDSVLGRYSIDENGDTTLSTFGGYTIRDGELAFLEVIEAAPIGERRASFTTSGTSVATIAARLCDHRATPTSGNQHAANTV